MDKKESPGRQPRKEWLPRDKTIVLSSGVVIAKMLTHRSHKVNT